MGKWGFKSCMITLGYDPFQSVNHGVPGSSPGEGANMKVIRNGDFFVYNHSLFLLFIDFLGLSPVEGLVFFDYFS